MTNFPHHIVFKADDNEAKLVEVLTKEKEPTARYQYIVSNTKKDKFFTTTLNFLEKLINGRLLDIR